MNIFDIIARILGALTNVFVATVADMFVGSVPTKEDDHKLYTYRHRSQHYQHHQEKRQLLINGNNSSSFSPLLLEVDTDGLNLSSNRLRGCGKFLSDASVMNRIHDNKSNNNNCLNKSFIDILRQISRLIIEAPTLLASSVPPTIPSASKPTMVAEPTMVPAPINTTASESSLMPLSESTPERSTSSQPLTPVHSSSSSLTLAMGPRQNLPIGHERACRLAMKQQLSQLSCTDDRHLKIQNDISLQTSLVSPSFLGLSLDQQEQEAGGEESEEQLSSISINTLWRCSPADIIETPWQRLQSDYLWDVWFHSRNIDGLNPFIVEMNRSLRNEVSVTVALNNCRKLSADSRRNSFLLSHGLTYEYFESQRRQLNNHQLESSIPNQSSFREELCSLDPNCNGPVENNEPFGLSSYFRHITDEYSRQMTIPTSSNSSLIGSSDELINSSISQTISTAPSCSPSHVQSDEESLLDSQNETFLSIMESLECPEVDYNIVQFGTVTRQLLDQIGYFNNGINNGLEYTFFVDFDENQEMKDIDSPSSLLSSEEERNNQPLKNTDKEDLNTPSSQSCHERSVNQESCGPDLDRALLRGLTSNTVLATAARAKAKAAAASAAFFVAATAAARTVANIQKKQDQNNADDIPQTTNDGLQQDNDGRNNNNIESSTQSNIHYYWDSNSLLNYVFLQEYQRQLAMHYQYVLAQHIQHILPTPQQQELFMNQLLQYQAHLQQQIQHHLQLRLKHQNDHQEEQKQQHRQATHLDLVSYSSSTSLLSSPSTSPPTSPPASPPITPQASRRISSQPSSILPSMYKTSKNLTSPSASRSSPLPLPSSCPAPSPPPLFPTPPSMVFQSALKAPSYSIPTSSSVSFQSRTCEELCSNTDFNINCITLIPPFFNMQQLMQKLNDQSQYYQQQFVAALNAYEGILCTQLMRHHCITNMTVTALQQNVQSQCQQQQQHLHQQHHSQFYQQQIQLQQMQQLQQQEQQQLSQLQQQFQQRQHQLLRSKPMNEMDFPTCIYRQTSPRLHLTRPSNDPPDLTLPSRRFCIPTSPIPPTIPWTEGDLCTLPSPHPYPHYYYHHYNCERQQFAITTNISDSNSNNNLAADVLPTTSSSSNSDPIDDFNDDELEQKQSSSVLSKDDSNDDTKHEDDDGIKASHNEFDEINLNVNTNNNIIQCSNREGHAINDQNTNNGTESNDILKTAIHISYNSDNNKKIREQ